MARLHILWCLGLLLVGCTATEGPTSRLDWPSNEPFKKRWLQSPIVVVGLAQSVATRSGSTIQRGEWSIDVRLHEITLDVENVIQGNVLEGPIRVYRYGYLSGQFPGSIPVDDILPGERRVFFLLPFGRNYRMIEDVVAGSFPVASGHHSRLPKNKPMLEQIAEVLILPGDAIDEDQYIRNLDVMSGSTVPALVGLERTILLLRELQTRGSRRIAAQACLSVYKLSPFGDRCIDEFIQDPELPVHKTVDNYVRGKATAMEEFKKNPALWFDAWVDNLKRMSYVNSTYRGDARFVLEDLVGYAKDRLVHRHAQMLLRDHLPGITAVQNREGGLATVLRV